MGTFDNTDAALIMAVVAVVIETRFNRNDGMGRRGYAAQPGQW